MIPGVNLLNLALGVIASQPVYLLRFVGLTVDKTGNRVPGYSAPVPVAGSFQPTSQTLIQSLGLDFNKNYHTLYCSLSLRPVDQNAAGDRVSYGGKLYQVETVTSWKNQDGWDAALCVEVKPDA